MKFLYSLSPKLTGNANEPKLQDGHHTTVYTADAILRHADVRLTQGGMILIALCSGGDYHAGGIPGCGVRIAQGLAVCGFGDMLLNAAGTLDDVGLGEFLDGWRNRLREELRSNSLGHLPHRCRHMADVFPPQFPSISLIRCYTNPVTSATHPGYETTPITWKSQIDLSALAGLCERHFEWGHSVGILQSFRSNLYPSIIIQLLRQLAWSEDGLCPYGLLVDVKSIPLKILDSQSTDVTDHMMELEVEIDLSCLDDIVGSGVRGSRPAEPSHQALRGQAYRRRFGIRGLPHKPNKTRSRSSSSTVKAWVPESMLIATLPNVVQKFWRDTELKRKKKQEAEEKHRKRLRGNRFTEGISDPLFSTPISVLMKALIYVMSYNIQILTMRA